MSTSGGLSRRRVGGGASSSNGDDDDTAPRPVLGNSTPPSPNHHHAGSAFQGGGKIAFDPRDLQQDASEEARIGGKMPRLTIMEEVLLLGIKDKQVCVLADYKHLCCCCQLQNFHFLGISKMVLWAYTWSYRVIYHFGTTTYPMRYGGVSSSSSLFVDA